MFPFQNDLSASGILNKSTVSTKCTSFYELRRVALGTRMSLHVMIYVEKARVIE